MQGSADGLDGCDIVASARIVRERFVFKGGFVEASIIIMWNFLG